MRIRRLPSIILAACAVLAVSACGDAPDLKQALQVTDVQTGWFDAGVVDGKNKLVPSITFRLRNTSNEEITTASLNLVFKLIDTGEEHDSIFLQRVDFTDKQTEPITVRSQTGHTGEPPQTRADMLKHSLFRDLEATIFVRQSSNRWVELHKVKIDRQLLTR